MPHRSFTIDELADYLHLARSDVEKLLRESNIPHVVRGGRTVFHRSDVDAWASQRILGLPERRLDAYHEQSMRATQSVFPDRAILPGLLKPGYIDLALSSKTRASTLRDMVSLADRTGRVFDARELLSSVEERETLCSTALPGGLALLHARHHLPYRFDGSFIVVGRTIQSVPFGAPDGKASRLFFLICCQDDRIHLHTLARLCLIALKTEVIALLTDVADVDVAYDVLIAAETMALPKAVLAAR